MNFDTGTKERREKHIQTLMTMRKTMLEDDNWESMKPYIEAVTSGGMALQRLNQIDFPNDTKKED